MSALLSRAKVHAGAVALALAACDAAPPAPSSTAAPPASAAPDHVEAGLLQGADRAFGVALPVRTERASSEAHLVRVRVPFAFAPTLAFFEQRLPGARVERGGRVVRLVGGRAPADAGGAPLVVQLLEASQRRTDVTFELVSPVAERDDRPYFEPTADGVDEPPVLRPAAEAAPP